MTRYMKPDISPGGIVIPDTSRADKTFTTWEVVAFAPPDEKDLDDREKDLLGMEMRRGDIIRTHRRAPVDTHLVTSEGLNVFVMGYDSVDVVIVNDWDDPAEEGL